MSIARHIKIELEIHAITCPGVWLCQNNGDIELRITALGYTFSGKPLKPRFPLCYHEIFIMDGYFSDVTTTAELEKALGEEQINFTLWQKGRRLAYYLNKIGVILNYTGCTNNNFATTDNAIIMTRGSCFPGTISPKIEYTASIRYNAKCIKCNRIVSSQCHEEKRMVKNLYEIGANKNKNLQPRPVCHAHTKQRHRWRHVGNIGTPSTHMRNEWNDLENDLCDYCLDTKDISIGTHAPYVSSSSSEATKKMDGNLEPVHRHENCGHLGSYPFEGSMHIENKCSICLKYSLLFDRSKEEINET